MLDRGAESNAVTPAEIDELAPLRRVVLSSARTRPRYTKPTNTFAWAIAALMALPSLFAPSLIDIDGFVPKIVLALLIGAAIIGQWALASFDLDELGRVDTGRLAPRQRSAFFAPLYLLRRSKTVELVDEKAATPMWFSLVASPLAFGLGAAANAFVLAAAQR